MKFTPVDHQFSLFGYNETKPKSKVPISAQRLREAKALMQAGDPKAAAAILREVREKLENYASRLTIKKRS